MWVEENGRGTYIEIPINCITRTNSYRAWLFLFELSLSFLLSSFELSEAFSSPQGTHRFSTFSKVLSRNVELSRTLLEEYHITHTDIRMDILNPWAPVGAKTNNLVCYISGFDWDSF